MKWAGALVAAPVAVAASTPASKSLKEQGLFLCKQHPRKREYVPVDEWANLGDVTPSGKTLEESLREMLVDGEYNGGSIKIHDEEAMRKTLGGYAFRKDGRTIYATDELVEELDRQLSEK